MFSKEEIKDEERKLRYLQMLVTLALQALREDPLTLEQAYELLENTRRAALKLFPGKDLVFQIIYEPRLLRTLRERWGVGHLH
jgi:hypothetical protein